MTAQPVPSSNALNAPAPLPADGLLDCSLYRYGDTLDEAIAFVLQAAGARIASDPVLQSAVRTGVRTDVTEHLRQTGLIQRVETCTKPVLRAFVEGLVVQLEVDRLQGTVCNELVASDRLRRTGMLVMPLDQASGRRQCGGPRNPVPNILTLGRLTLAGRMLPGENLVTVVARGPFGAPSVAPGPICPTLEGRPDPVVEDMITMRRQDRTDQPRRWTVEPCLDLLGSSSSMGVCTTKQWENYHDRMKAEFRNILARATQSGDRLRIMSAAAWLIERSDPAKYTVLSYDYRGRECDLIRNRFVLACGVSVLDTVLSGLPSKGMQIAIDPTDPKIALDTIADEIIDDLERRKKIDPRAGTILGCFQNYGPVSGFLERFVRPPQFSKYRQDLLDEMGSDVQSAMRQATGSSCSYYAHAVDRLDQRLWEFQYQGGMTTKLPPDWDHDFKLSAAKCLLGR